MTGYTVHTGSTVKYSSGWDNIFSGPPRRTRSDRQETGERRAKKEDRPRAEKGR